MKRVEDSAAQAPERGHYSGQDYDAGERSSAPIAKCDWGKPERSGNKPTWYLNLFH